MGAAVAAGPEAAALLRGFLTRHASVELWEEGQRVACLRAEDSGFALSVEASRLVCHFWSGEANLVRRVLAVEAATAARLRLRCLRMGQSQPSRLVLTAGAEDGDASFRDDLRQAVVAAARRDWAGWTYEPGGSRAHGPVRMLFRRGHRLLLCLAVDARHSTAAQTGVLAQALSWAAQVQTDHPEDVVAAIRLVLPAAAQENLVRRRPWLRSPPDRPAIEAYHLDLSAGRLEPGEVAAGNAASALRRAPARPEDSPGAAAAQRLLEEIRQICPQATLETSAEGGLGFRLYGLEIARQADTELALTAPFTFGYGRERTPLVPTAQAELLRLLRQLAQQRVPGGRRADPLYSLYPERWMEHVLRSDVSRLDVQLRSQPVYAQVPVCGAGQREVLDLLALDRQQRLVVIELKADEDLGFPLQGLDYWIEVRRHQLAGDFTRLGYFPGEAISPLPPRLWLVAPALRWHPQTEAVTGWLSPAIPCACLGINEEWRHGLQVVYRKEIHPG